MRSYYILAVQYMGALLNIANDASSTSAVDAVILAATNFFNITTPAQGAALNCAAKNNVLALATTLANYNTGVTGPDHCSESAVL